MNALIVIGSVVFMEFVAWFTHKYIMHGFLWVLHKSHHEPRKGSFELNDWFFVYFAAISMICFYFGYDDKSWPFYVAIGVAIYGFLYFSVHDLFIHGRIRVFGPAKALYFKALRQAHYAHHAKHGKHDGESFGMLVVARKYWKAARDKKAV